MDCTQKINPRMDSIIIYCINETEANKKKRTIDGIGVRCASAGAVQWWAT